MLSNKPQLSLLVRTGPTTDAKLETHARGGASPSPHFVRAQKSRWEKPCWVLPGPHPARLPVLRSPAARQNVEFPQGIVQGAPSFAPDISDKSYPWPISMAPSPTAATLSW